MFELEALNYEVKSFDGLSEKSFDVHRNKHHQNYINSLNSLLEKVPELRDKEIEEVIEVSFKKRHEDLYGKIFNNAAQHWNHDFFWKSLCPKQKPLNQSLLVLINKSFGSVESLKERFIEVGLGLFGSGWVWIVFNEKDEVLQVVATQNAENPIQVKNELTPLLACDVWEHAYYIDHLNNRKHFLEVVFSYFNWDFAFESYCTI